MQIAVNQSRSASVDGATRPAARLDSARAIAAYASASAAVAASVPGQSVGTPRTTTSATSRPAHTSHQRRGSKISKAIASAGWGFQGVMFRPWSGRM
jgi:hypothetical protein